MNNLARFADPLALALADSHVFSTAALILCCLRSFATDVELIGSPIPGFDAESNSKK